MHDFLKAAQEILRAKAVDAAKATETAKGERERMDFLAHLFAICTFMQEVCSDSSMRTVMEEGLALSTEERTGIGELLSIKPIEQTVLSDAWSQVPQHLEQLAHSSIPEAYQLLLGLLLKLEQTFPWTYSTYAKPPAYDVKLSPISAEGHDELRGVVCCWVHPRSGLRELLIQRDQSGKPITRYMYRPCDQLRCVGMVWDRGPAPKLARVTPSTRVPSLPVNPRKRLRQDGAFRVALCPLLGAFHPRFIVLDGKREFAVDASQPIYQPERLAEHLAQLVTDASEREIDVLIMPELSVDGDALAKLKERLSKETFPHIVVAGSFHDEQSGMRRNRAPVLGQGGALIWHHDKRGHFQISGEQAKSLAAPWQDLPGMFTSPIPDSTEEGTVFLEGIEYGNEVRLLDTPVGRIAVLICADALDGACGYRNLVESASVDLLLVVSMSPKTSPFRQWAEELCRHGTAVFFVNAGSLLTRAHGHPESIAAFVSLPFRTEPDGCPTQVRWRLGTAAIEVARRPDLWKQEEADGDALALLPDDRGLVVDLGAWWRETFMKVGKRR